MQKLVYTCTLTSFKCVDIFLQALKRVKTAAVLLSDNLEAQNTPTQNKHRVTRGDQRRL